jgi:hypothetical protein
MKHPEMSIILLEPTRSDTILLTFDPPKPGDKVFGRTTVGGNGEKPVPKEKRNKKHKFVTYRNMPWTIVFQI